MQGSDGTELGNGIMLELVKHMAPVDRSVWRLVDKAACQAVYEGATALSPSSTSINTCTALPLPLLDKCSGLKQLSCYELKSLSSIRGLPAGLEVLNISGTNITDLSPLQHHTALLQLSVVGMETRVIMQHLPPVLQQLTGLQLLDLNNGLLGGRGMQALAPALLHLTGLQQLRLGMNRIGAEGAQALAHALRQLTGLQQLDLSCNEVGVEGARALAPALQQLTGLQQLHLDHSDIGAEGARALAPALEQLTRLEQLDLSNSAVGAEGTRALAPALLKLTGLRQLFIANNEVGAEGARALAPTLQLLTGLQQLDFRHNAMGAEGARALAPVIKTLPNLHVIMDFQGYVLLDEVTYAVSRRRRRLKAAAEAVEMQGIIDSDPEC